MHGFRSFMAAAALSALVFAAPASASFDHNLSITADHTSDGWTSADGSGANVSNNTDGLPRNPAPYTCGKDPNTYCDTALVHLVLTDVGGGNVKVRLDGFKPTSDFDLRVYPADETGAPTGDYIRPDGDRATPSDPPVPMPTVPSVPIPSPGPLPAPVPVTIPGATPSITVPWIDPMTAGETSAGDYETTNVDLSGYVDDTGNIDQYFLIDIIYFTVVNDHYTVKTDLTSTEPFVPPTGDGE